jgi:hypothetical protein
VPHLHHAERPSKMLTCGQRNVVIGQAERPSNRAGAPRASRPFFLFIHRLQAQAYSRGLRALRGSPAQRYFFLFIHRLQAQAHSNRVGQPRASSPPPPPPF